MTIKKIILLVLILILLVPNICHAKLKIICSLFPQYDFTRQITKDFADVNLLLKPGTDPHEFDPTPRDLLNLNNSDLFIYTGDNMEHWAEKIINSLNSNVKILNVSTGINFLNDDPHIWLNMRNAQIMAKNILIELSRLDPDNAEFYNLNAENLINELKILDSEFTRFQNKNLIFAGPFSYAYFVNCYGINYLSAYNGENEPSIKNTAEIIKFIRDNNIKYIFCDAYGITSISNSIAQQSGSEILIFNSAHDVRDNKNFIEIMKSNLNNLKIALNLND